MLANQIDLPVDILNNGTPVTESFSRHTQELNKTIYNGPNHSVASPNTLTVYRTLPKRSGLYPGSAKTAIKLSSTVTIPNVEGNNIPAALIGECSFSVPVGVTVAQTLALRQRMIAALDHAMAASLVDVLEI